MKKNKATPKSSPKSIQINDTSVKAQQARILEELEVAEANGLTTIQIRDDLNCLHAAGRIMELREQGCVILTRWTTSNDSHGRRHRIARYVLIRRQGVAA